MLTLLGKELRLIRLECGELLKDMAGRLDKTPAYLSAIENGKRLPTEKFINQLIEEYELSTEQKNNVLAAFFLTVKEIRISIDIENVEQEQLGVIFARKFNSLSEKQIKDIKSILTEEDVY